MVIVGWLYTEPQPARVWTCGHCGAETGSKEGYGARATGHAIYICPVCDRPTYFDGATKEQIPGVRFGVDMRNLPPDVQALYDEARACMAVRSYTAVVLLCRKLLMHAAVSKGAEEGWKFYRYVDYLGDEGYVPKQGAIWLELIRDKGNDANHEIAPMGMPEAERLMRFLGVIFPFIYDLPSKA